MDPCFDQQAFGVYVHWPFCAAKCPYCDFNSHVRHQPVDQAAFVEAYEREVKQMAGLAPRRTVTSIFVGGGTPSLMEPATLARILEAVASAWTVAGDAEITLEANPSSVESARFAGYRDAGVNRLSLGVQSFDDRQLRFLGRLHDAEQARQAIGLAREAFPRLSFDLIYARPGQQAEDWERELRQALALAADHLSLYQLTIEPGTPFFDLQARGRLEVPDSDRAAELYELTQAVTAAAGLPAYEISNHAAPGAECAHNLVYWRYHDYAGIGPGAHGRLTIDGIKHATAAERRPEQWWQAAMVAGHGMAVFEPLAATEQADEMLLMGLRLAEGVDAARYERLAGRPLDPARIAFLEEQGLVGRTPRGSLRATPAGFLVLDAVVADLAA
ncbi:MAG: coproporphyrinogen III oxidase [Alphaproteobacteria bacterium]|nr:MAG: coproporphyrinogen III oxidase [Alphaproteobacteria bacterium]